MFKSFIYNNRKVFKNLGIMILVIIALKIMKEDMDPYKIDQSEDYVYTYKSTDFSQVPFVNLNSDEIMEFNQTLLDDYYDLLDKNEDILYEYYQSGDILSLLVLYCSIESVYDVKTYNFSIKKQKILSDEQVLELFDIDTDYIADKLTNKVYEYYSYELKKGYISNDITFEEYLKKCEVDKINDDLAYFIVDNELFLYKHLTIDYRFYSDKEKPFKLYEFDMDVSLDS